ncbi:MAG TPA: septum formation family protein [Trebonia sp.]
MISPTATSVAGEDLTTQVPALGGAGQFVETVRVSETVEVTETVAVVDGTAVVIETVEVVEIDAAVQLAQTGAAEPAADRDGDSEAAAEDGAEDGAEDDLPSGEYAEFEEYEFGADEFDGDEFDGDDAHERADLINRAELVELDETAEPFRRARRWPRVLIAFGFVILAAAIVGGAFAIVGSVTHGFKKPVKITYKKSALFSLKTGDCLDSQGQSYSLLSCAAPHEAEVFATFKLATGTWPGTTAVAAAASSGCKTRLTGYLNPQLAISLTSAYVYPDATSWKAGTRTVICEVRAPSGSLTGSVRTASASAG